MSNLSQIQFCQEDARLAIVRLPIDQLFVSQGNIRKLEIEAKDLIPSIIEQGRVIKPLDVYREGDRYAIIDGQRRFLAVKQIVVEHPDLKDNLGLLPCVVHADVHNEEEAFKFSFTNSILSKDTPPLDKARAARKLIEQYGSQDEVCKRFGISYTVVPRWNFE